MAKGGDYGYLYTKTALRWIGIRSFDGGLESVRSKCQDLVRARLGISVT